MIAARRTVIVGLSVIALLAFWVWGPLIAEAQEDGAQTFRQLAGPYQIEIIVVESSLSLGTVVLFITVTEAATGQPVPDARVVLRTLHVATSKEGEATAHNTVQFPARYDAQLNLDNPGQWEITVEVRSSLGAVGVEIPPLEVPAMQRFTSGTVVFAVVFGVIIATTIYLILRYQRQRRRRLAPPSIDERTGANGDPGAGPSTP